MWILTAYHSRACLSPVYTFSHWIALRTRQRTFLRICTTSESQILSFASLYLWGPQKHSAVSQLSLMHRKVTPGQKLPSIFSFYLSRSFYLCGLVIMMYCRKCSNLSPKMFRWFQLQVWSELSRLTYTPTHDSLILGNQIMSVTFERKGDVWFKMRQAWYQFKIEVLSQEKESILLLSGFRS